MSLYDVPSEAEINTIRSQWSRNSEDGSTIHRLCDAIELLKNELHIDDRHTIPTPPPEEVDPPGVVVPPSKEHHEHRCAACLHQFIPVVLPATCPACGSQDVFSTNSTDWPCGNCGKCKDGLDPCKCSSIEVMFEVEEDSPQPSFNSDLRRV